MLVHELAARQREQLDERGLTGLLNDIELPLVRVLRETEDAGIKLDTRRLEEAASRIRSDAEVLEREIWELAGEEFMIGSPQQLAEVLFVKLGLSRKRRGKTGFSTDARVLQAIRDEHPIIPKVERWRELTKLVSTYLDALPAWIGPDGRLHTTFQQTNTATGRLSSINPNLQNIPIRTETGRVIRQCFVAEPGNVLLSVDYSQVELRVLAHIAGEEVLQATSSGAGRTSTPRPRRPSSRCRPSSSTSACARRRRWSTTGSSTGSRPTGSPTACRSTRTRRRSSSTATWPASPPSRSS